MQTKTDNQTASDAPEAPMEWQKLNDTPEGYSLWTKLDDTGREIFKYERTQPSSTEGGYYNAESAAKLKNLAPNKANPTPERELRDEQAANFACPLPWSISPRGNVIDAEENNVATNYGDNAKLIVRAVNHAEALAKALRDLRTRIVATDPNCLNTTKADEALAAYEAAQ